MCLCAKTSFPLPCVCLFLKKKKRFPLTWIKRIAGRTQFQIIIIILIYIANSETTKLFNSFMLSFGTAYLPNIVYAMFGWSYFGMMKNKVENMRENRWEGCLIERKMGENWSATIFTQNPPKLGRK